MLNELIILLNRIIGWHIKFSEDFIRENEAYNLRKKRVDHVLKEDEFDHRFVLLVYNYIKKITEEYLYFDFESTSNQIDTRLRGKAKESVLNKLYYYRFGAGRDSKVPLKKCMNDILGFRIILKDFEQDYKDIEKYIKSQEEISSKLHVYHRKDKEYNAVHVYIINKNNKFFPWELQIWKSDDEVKNEQSHRSHKEKREYLSWPESYKEMKYIFEEGGE